MRIEGRNSVAEALRSDNVTVNSLICERGADGGIIALARQKGVKVTFVDRAVMDKMSNNAAHQGYIADVTDFQYCDIDDILAASEQPFVVVLDGLNDPHNFGSIIRSCECAGVDGIIIARNRQVAVTDTVLRISAGAAAHVRIARVANINNAVKKLQDRGVWVYALDMDGKEITATDLTGAVAIVVGAEGEGISPYTKKCCDGVVSLRLKGKVNSLNASVACGIALYEVVQQRG